MFGDECEMLHTLKSWASRTYAESLCDLESQSNLDRNVFELTAMVVEKQGLLKKRMNGYSIQKLTTTKKRKAWY